jgi:hypothetical protein
VQAVIDNLPVMGDADAFYRRVLQGYRLNDIGSGSSDMIAAFDLERELLQALERKRDLAGMVHSDFCRIGGRTVNDWLCGSQSITRFLDALQKCGWIRRRENPCNSRFWQLVHGEKAAMYGVFTEFEQQLLHDWIADGWQAPDARHRLPQWRLDQHDAPWLVATPDAGDIDSEQRELLQVLHPLDALEQCLIALASPALHATAAGLLATRMLAGIVR